MPEMRLIRRLKKDDVDTGIRKISGPPLVRKSVVVELIGSATFLERRRIGELNRYFLGESDAIDVDTSA